MSRLLAFFFLVLGLSPALATLTVTPISVRITMENGRLAYAFNGEAITPDRIPEKLSGEIYKFGTKQSLEIVISDQVPLAALLEVDRLVKESGMEGPVGFSLARVNEAPPKSSDPILGGEEALFSITLTPMPERREDKR